MTLLEKKAEAESERQKAMEKAKKQKVITSEQSRTYYKVSTVDLLLCCPLQIDFAFHRLMAIAL